MDKTIVKRWGYLTISAVGLLFVGIIYAWSVLKTPIATEFGWEASQMAFNYTLTLFSFCIGSLLVGFLSSRVSFKILLPIAAALIFIAYFIVSRLTGKSIFTLYISYGVIFGIGIGMAYNILLSVGNSWFPDKKGVSAGILMMSFGFSTMLIGKQAAKMFDMETFGWRKTFLILGIVIFIVLLIGSIVLKKPTENVIFPEKKDNLKKKKEVFESRDYSTAEVIRRPTFWLFYIYGVLAVSVGSTVISFARDFALTIGAQPELATTMVGVLSICNGLGRIICGFSFDKFGRWITMTGLSVVTLASPILMLSSLHFESLPMGVLSMCITGLSYGCYPALNASFISNFYGMKNFSMNYSISNTKLLFASFASTVAASLLTSTGSYTAPFVMLMGTALLSLILNFFIKSP